MSDAVFTGIIRGKTIELDAKPELPDGQEVAVTVQPLIEPVSNPESVAEALRLRLAAIPATATVVPLVNAPLKDADIPHLSRLTHLKRINLAGTHITDHGLLALAEFPELEWVCVNRTQVTIDGVNRALATHPALTVVLGVEPGPLPASEVLATEMATFQRELPRLLAAGEEGRWALIQGEKLDSVWDSHSEAIHAGDLRFGLIPFLIEEVLTKPRIVNLTRLFR